MSRLAEWSTGGNYMKGGVGGAVRGVGCGWCWGESWTFNSRIYLTLIVSLRLQRRALGRNGARASAAIEIIERSHRFVESWLCGICFPPREHRRDEGVGGNAQQRKPRSPMWKSVARRSHFSTAPLRLSQEPSFL